MRRLGLLFAVAAVTSAWPAAADPFTPGATWRASLGTGAVQANDHSSEPVVSADGRWVAFRSKAENLVPDDANGKEDVFLRDTAAGTTTLVSRRPDGSRFPTGTSSPTISRDGRSVAFSSGWAQGDSSQRGSFLYDRLSGTTPLVSVDQNGVPQPLDSPQVSADGSMVLMTRHANAWIWRRSQGFARPVINAATGQPLVGDLFDLSPDGRYLGYTDWEPEPVFGIVYLMDLQTGDVERISDGLTFSLAPTVSEGGRVVLYMNVPTGAFWANLVVVDRQTGLVDVMPNATDAMLTPSMSDDGKVVVWTSLGALTGNPLTPLPGVYAWDRPRLRIEQVSVSSQGVPAILAFGNTASADGRFVGFTTDEALEPDDTNAIVDAYVRDRRGPCQVQCLLPE